MFDEIEKKKIPIGSIARISFTRFELIVNS